ncbi:MULTISPECIES: hypothetical protein [unclassified Microcoleus]|uniref:hypothetical protein n=1 Tax=unclassified Microcoleus TaxID=2642155 RepID=UPI002FD67773
MTFLKISVPLYKKHKWERLERGGKIEVSSEVDNLADGYESLKIQIDNLIAELDGQNRLADNCHQLEDQIQEKTQTLEALVKDIEQATKHYEDLKFFLRRLGVDPTANRLTLDEKFLRQYAPASQVEVLGSESEF